MSSTLRNFVDGAGSTIDICPSNVSPKRRLYTPPSSGYEALRNDFIKIGRDLKQAFGNEQEKLAKK